MSVECTTSRRHSQNLVAQDSDALDEFGFGECSRIGITGHVRLGEGTDALVFEALRAALRRYANVNLHGVTCLAAGADQIFARAILAMNGTLEVILPAADYRERVISPENLPCFDELLDQAIRIQRMPFPRSGRPAYVAASEEMLERCDALIAVWDVNPSRKPGDTADVVATALQRQIPVTVLWPAGADRR
jgi:hypothetical protein